MAPDLSVRPRASGSWGDSRASGVTGAPGAPGSAPTTTVALAREAAVLAGAGAAILLQVAHRPVAVGVDRHSAFTADPSARLLHTLQYVYAVSLPEAEPARDSMAGGVRSAHAPVHGVDAGGQRYSADDPEAQRWVAATLYWAAEQVRWRLWGVLDAPAAEQMYRDYAVLGTALGMPAELWPPDRAAFGRYWERSVASLEVTDEARRIARELFAAEQAPRWLRSMMPLARFVTAGMLPPAVRTQLGLDWDGADSVREDRLWSVVRRMYPVLPLRLRHWPARWVVRSLLMR